MKVTKPVAVIVRNSSVFSSSAVESLQRCGTAVAGSTCRVAGVGGHGGSGIHADIDDKYREIVTRVSNYSPLRQPRPVVPVSPCQKTFPLVAPAPAPVPPPPSQVDRGQVTVRTPTDHRDSGSGDGGSNRGGENPSSSATGAASARRAGSGQVQSVQVTKCTVCTILWWFRPRTIVSSLQKCFFHSF